MIWETTNENGERAVAVMIKELKQLEEGPMPGKKVVTAINPDTPSAHVLPLIVPSHFCLMRFTALSDFALSLADKVSGLIAVTPFPGIGAFF